MLDIIIAVCAVLVILLLVIVGGGLLTLLATWFSRFLSQNNPSVDVMSAFNASETARLVSKRSTRKMEKVQVTNETAGKEDEPISGTDRVFDYLGRYSRYVALLAAWVATCGSLYMSEVLGWVPCLLCWYQRILMYPLSLIMTVGLLRRDRGLHKYVLALSIPGMCVSLFHYLDQKTDLVAAFVPCNVGVPCSADYLNAFGGLVTIPFLAGTAFLIITFCMIASRLGTGSTEDESSGDDGPATEQPGRLATALPVFAIIAVVVVSFVIAGISHKNAAASTVTSIPSLSEKPLPTPDSESFARGKVLYEETCAACHGVRAEGTTAGRPLTTSQLVITGTDEDLFKFVRLGRAANDPHNTTGLNMPASGGRTDASDRDIAAVIAYMRRLAKGPA
jgi:disulfide bond formation protein DsbB/cytochrome c5